MPRIEVIEAIAVWLFIFFSIFFLFILPNFLQRREGNRRLKQQFETVKSNLVFHTKEIAGHLSAKEKEKALPVLLSMIEVNSDYIKSGTYSKEQCMEIAELMNRAVLIFMRLSTLD